MRGPFASIEVDELILSRIKVHRSIFYIFGVFDLPEKLADLRFRLVRADSTSSRATNTRRARATKGDCHHCAAGRKNALRLGTYLWVLCSLNGSKEVASVIRDTIPSTIEMTVRGLEEENTGILVRPKPERNDPTLESQKSETSLDNCVLTAEDLDDNNENERDPLDPRELKIRHWEQSPFAVGCVNVTWQDDRKWFRPESSHYLEQNPQICCSAYVCGCLGAGRVGNLAILAQTTEDYDHLEIVNEETGEQRTTKRKRPKLLCVLGPFWPINFFLTYPLILGVSLWTGWRNLPGAHMAIVVSWSFCTALLILSLAMVACRNPGVLHRHSEPPPDCDDWKWNDQAKTYRPLKARFDPECQVVVEGFDHT